MTARTTTAKSATVTSVNRFRGPDCKHANSHITKAAALSCAGDKDARLTVVPRWFAKVTGQADPHRFGHKEQATAETCAKTLTARTAKAAPKAPAPKPAAPKTATAPKATAPKAATPRRTRARLAPVPDPS